MYGRVMLGIKLIRGQSFGSHSMTPTILVLRICGYRLVQAKALIPYGMGSLLDAAICLIVCHIQF